MVLGDFRVEGTLDLPFLDDDFRDFEDFAGLFLAFPEGERGKGCGFFGSVLGVRKPSKLLWERFLLRGILGDTVAKVSNFTPVGPKLYRSMYSCCRERNDINNLATYSRGGAGPHSTLNPLPTNPPLLQNKHLPSYMHMYSHMTLDDAGASVCVYKKFCCTDKNGCYSDIQLVTLG